MQATRHKFMFGTVMLLQFLILSSCSFSTLPGQTPQQIMLIADGPVKGSYPLDDGMEITYEYTLQPESSYSQGMLELHFDLHTSPAAADELLVNLLVLDEHRKPVFINLLFEIRQGVLLTGNHRELRIEPYQARSLAFAIDKAPSAHRSPAVRTAVEGIVLEEGENISGSHPWANTSTRIRYTYTFHRALGADPGLLEMEFELIDAEQFSTLDIDLVIVDKSKRYLGGGLLFEREQGLTRSGNLRTLAIEPYTAYAFDFVGGGFRDTNPRRF